MTRFEKELSGSLGAFWKQSAEKELTDVKNDLEKGNITVDETGIARNCIGRVLMSDMLEKLMYVTDKVDAAATNKAREEENLKWIEDYRKNSHPVSSEELDKMRAAFGKVRRL